MTGRKTHRPWLSLRLALLSVAAVVLIPVLVVTVWLTLTRAQEYRNTVADTLLAAVRALSVAVDHQLEESVAVLQTLANDPVLESRDWPRIHARLATVMHERESASDCRRP
jgi:hypothetical protein